MAQAQSVQGGFDAGVGRVAVAGLERLQQLAVGGEPGVEFAGARLGQRPFGPAQFGLQGPQVGEGVVDGVLDGVVRGQVGGLREVPGAAGRVDPNVSGVGQVGAGEEPEQGRLAGAVLADDADALAEGHRLVDAVQEEPAAGGAHDVVQDDLEGARAGRGHGGGGGGAGGRVRGTPVHG